MPPDQPSRPLARLPRLVDAWLNGDAGATEELQRMLGKSRDARSYFIGMLQVESELEWRYASADEVAQTLTKRPDGSEYPAAAIVATQMSYRDDPGFAAVLDRLSGAEEAAQLWLRLYPLVRAALFVCLPAGSNPEAVAGDFCARLVGAEAAPDRPESLLRAASDAAAASLENVAHAGAPEDRRAYARMIRVLIGPGVDLDVVAISDALDNAIPGALPTADLRLLCRRYLLEQTPAQLAGSQHLPLPEVYKRLASGRVRALKRCMGQPQEAEVAGEVRALSLLNLLIDRRLASGADSSPPRGKLSRAEAVNGLADWAEQGAQHREYVLRFAMLHEALNRNLSLHRLLDESKSQDSVEFHQVLSEMVREFEDAPPSIVPRLAAGQRPLVTSRTVSWIAAAAAVIALAVGLATRQTPPVPESGGVGPPLAERAPVAEPADEPIAPRPAPPREEQPPPPAPVVVAAIATALDVAIIGDAPPDPGAELPTAGADVHEGQRLAFDQGVVRVLTPTRCEWVLEGPIAVVFHSGARVELERGRLVGHNRGGDRPLVVEAPNAEVVDLGTEFGVSVDAEHATRVAVYEGSVALTAAASGEVTRNAAPLQIEANEKAELTAAGTLPTAPTPLQHDREFIRSDELDLRVDEKAGSADAAKRVAFYELLRTEDLLAYQGFDQEEDAQQFSIGFAQPALRQSTEPQLAGVRRFPAHELLATDELVIPNGGCYFIDLDVSPEGRLARQGLLDADNKVGRRECELWLHWKSKAAVTEGDRFDWMGVSLMSGDRRNLDEPLFVGQPNDLHALGIHSFGRDDRRFALDSNSRAAGVQGLQPDSQWHTWVLRVRCLGDGSADVGVWCDVALAELEDAPPQATTHFDRLQFDRFRLEVSESGANGAGVFDELLMTSSLDGLRNSLTTSAAVEQAE